MPNRLSLQLASAAFLVAVSFGFSSPALAGFQWIAPNDSASAPPMGALPNQPSSATTLAPPQGASTPEIISPLVIGGNPQPLPPTPAMQIADNAPVVGFAKSVPLPVALRQILPAGYAFSIDQDVDMGTLVSFQGGRGWRETLRDALAPSGLTMREQGQMVAVGFSRAAAPVAASPAPVPAPTSAPTLTPAPVYQTGTEPKNLGVPEGESAVIAPLPGQTFQPSPALSQPAISPAPVLNEVWTAERGQMLHKILEDWCRRANVEFDWLSEYDYPLQASVSFPGNFENATRSLLGGFEGAHPQPTAELHSNPDMGQMVLVVRTRGNTNSD